MTRLASEWPRVSALAFLAGGVLLAGAFTLGSLARPSPAANLRPQLAAERGELARRAGQLAGVQAALRTSVARETAQAVTIANLQARLRARAHYHRR